MPSLPILSGREVIKVLNAIGYQEVRQRGSHIRLERTSAEETRAITVPNHREIAKGTLNDIINAIANATNRPKTDLIYELRNI